MKLAAHTVAELASARQQHQEKLADHHGARGGGHRKYKENERSDGTTGCELMIMANQCC